MSAVAPPRTPQAEEPPVAPSEPNAGVGVGIVDAPPEPGRDRGGYIGLWALLGVLLAALAASIWIRWVASPTEFSPAPILGPDEIPTWNLVVLRIEEALSVVEMAALVTFAVILPLRLIVCYCS